MSEKVACLAVFGFLLVFLLAFFALARKTDLRREENEKDTSITDVAQAIAAWRQAARLSEKFFVLFLCSPIFMRKGFAYLMVAMATVLTGGLVAICATDAVEILRIVREMLLDFYRFIERSSGAKTVRTS